MKKKISLWIWWVILLCAVLVGTALFSLCAGPAAIPAKRIVSLIFEGRGSAEYSIIFDIRLPRIVLGMAVGGALSLAGVMLQGIFRNPLVEPYTLGISGGAALGVCINIFLGLNRAAGLLSLPLSGFIGSILIILLVYSFSVRKGVLRIHGLLLTGVMISFISASLIMLIMAVSRTEDLHGIILWIMGSLGEPNWVLIKVMLFVSIGGLIAGYFYRADLNAFMLGEEEAMHLGVDTERTKRNLFIIASLLTGCSVSVAGIIGFVGLVIPHLVRILIGRDHRILLVASFLAGGAFLILCDTAARTIIAPVELPVGVITGIFGGALFIYALTKTKFILGEK
ncbi:MAG: iron ABC transporter permease [Candidatus Omnitrophica bacterium]|nr:iron ABC transporter permease [Candidatus Omnitrophota bacterium]